MTYVIPDGYSRISFDFGGVSAIGSKPSWGIGVAANPSIAITDRCLEWWDEGPKSLAGEGWTLERVTMRNDVSACESVLSITGTSTAQHQPPNVAVLIKLSTGAIGRANRGRIYWSGMLLDGDVNEQGSIVEGAITQNQGYMNDLVAALVTLEAPPVILHSTNAEPTPVLTATVQNTAATQRRRLRR